MTSADWTQMSDDELLEMNISRLGLKIEGTGWEASIRQLYAELDERGLVFHPPVHIGDEWFCPMGIPAIYVPFFLMHPRLMELERRMFLEVEGEHPEDFMRLLRHEAGHAYSYAYRLQKRRKWQEHFGLETQEENEFYRPRPYSRSFVIHLADWYAQSHPDEDWAETFAVWLTPDSDWQTQYANWKAIHKLNYTEGLMKSLRGRPPMHQPKYRVRDYNFLNLKLKTYYQRKRKQNEHSFPDFYDPDLMNLFHEAREAAGSEKASRFLKRRRRELLNVISTWTSESKFRINLLLKRLIERCDELDLRVKSDDPNLELRLSSYITSLVMNYLFTGRFKRSRNHHRLAGTAHATSAQSTSGL